MPPPTNPPPSSDSSALASVPEGILPVAKPLAVRLRVIRLVPEGGDLRLVGVLGETTYRARRDDRVEVEALLSEPAYAYLIAFNPTDRLEDREQLVPQSEAEQQPPKRVRLSPDRRLRLDDGEGLQAFAVVASRQPLPAYSKWRERRPSLTWGRVPATPGVVWRSDGDRVDGEYDSGFVRATEEAIGGKAVISRLVKALKRMPGVEAVAVVGFAVDRVD
jgi:hypothetical protein